MPDNKGMATVASIQDAWNRNEAWLYHRILSADLQTPVAAFLKTALDEPYSFLFESVEGGAWRGRYSFFGLAPDVLWRCVNGKPELTALLPGGAAAVQAVQHEQDVFASLRKLYALSCFPLDAGIPPMVAGLFGMLGYDLVRQMEHLPDTRPDPLGLEEAVMMRPTIVGVFDHVRDILLLAAPLWPSVSETPEAALTRASQQLDDMETRLRAALPDNAVLPPLESPASTLDGWQSNMGRDAYCAAVEKAREYIHAGDIFQVVPSQRFSMPFTGQPFSFYRRLRQLNPSPFLFYVQLGNYQLVGSSPEILVRLRDDTVTIRPLAGTRPRGRTPEEDARLAADLLADPKERSEHLMLLDLGRNDVGRVATGGSVRVTEQFVVEHYSHVMHIVSNVTGTLAPGKDALDALIAGFPAGTVSGAPKVRAMEIIDELEPCPRRFYGGAIGYLSSGGAMDTCIALRTALVKDGMVHVQAGAGVVADSVPDLEHQETCNKAMALLRAAATTS